jgi:tRNA dimethylallyltransferase
MIDQGWLDEVRALLARYDWQLPSMFGLGYPQLGAMLRGEVPLAETMQQLKHHTQRFVRHQCAWFCPADEGSVP